MTRFALLVALVAVVTMSTSAVLDAQRGGRGGGGARGGGSGFQAGVNLPAAPIPPSAGMSISRPIGTQITGVQTNPPPGFGPPLPSPFAARPGTYTRLHRTNTFGIPYGYGNAYGYGFPAYGSYVPETTYDKYFRTPEPEVTTGALFLDVTPASALVYVDTAYVGSVVDLQTRGVTLSGGRHFVDLEAPGYERKTIEILIRAGEPLRYRFDMVPERRAEAVVIPPRPPQTLYAIAGCYAGNRPPVAENLPKGCDIGKVRVIRPQPARANQ
jgi:hypothetical protein